MFKRKKIFWTDKNQKTVDEVSDDILHKAEVLPSSAIKSCGGQSFDYTIKKILYNNFQRNFSLPKFSDCTW